MGMMTLSLSSGEEVTVIAEGSDEESAVADLEKFLQGSQK
jgi:catabolite repression HPr-like protein